jgi:hypothetical protein
VAAVEGVVEAEERVATTKEVGAVEEGGSEDVMMAAAEEESARPGLMMAVAKLLLSRVGALQQFPAAVAHMATAAAEAAAGVQDEVKEVTGPEHGMMMAAAVEEMAGVEVLLCPAYRECRQSALDQHFFFSHSYHKDKSTDKRPGSI